MTYSEYEISSIAPSGTLRATINLGNPILAREEDGKPAGVSADLARALAENLGVALELVVLDAAGKAVDAVVSGRADVGFFATLTNWACTAAIAVRVHFLPNASFAAKHGNQPFVQVSSRIRRRV